MIPIQNADASAQAPASGDIRPVVIRQLPIELCQFIKFGGLTANGGEAKQLIREGQVLLNGAVETRKGRKLAAGDQVKALGQTLVVTLA